MGKATSNAPVFKNGHFSYGASAFQCIYCDKDYSVSTSTGSLRNHLIQKHQLDPDKCYDTRDCTENNTQASLRDEAVAGPSKQPVAGPSQQPEAGPSQPTSAAKGQSTLPNFYPPSCAEKLQTIK